MSSFLPFFFRKFFIPYGLRLRTNENVFAKAFELFKIAAVNQFVIRKIGWGKKLHEAKVSMFSKNSCSNRENLYISLMKAKLTALVFLLMSFNLFSQGVNNLWLMGAQSWAGPPLGEFKMDFTGGNLNMTSHYWIMNFNCTNAEICDGSGNFLFSSNGIWVSNADNDTMLNGGRGFNPGFFTTQHDSFGLTLPQANLIIPFPGDTNRYYLFHETCDDYGNSYCTLYLYYSVIDMTLDSGLGAVTQKNVVLLNDSLVEGRLTACKHANGRDWWLVTHQHNTNRYYKYLITPDSILGPYTQDIGVVRDNWGQAVFSPDGTMYAYFAYFFGTADPNGSNIGDLDIFDFDRCTGDFSYKAHVAVTDSAYAGGVAFSPNSNVLYVSSSNFIWQFDMNAVNIPASQMTVAIWDRFLDAAGFYTSFYLSQLAPDGKIYIITNESTDYLHVINFPDSIGVNCDACQHCIHLPAYNHFTIANHPNYFLGPEIGSICDSLLSSILNTSNEKISLKIFPNPVSYNDDITFTYPSIGDKTFLVINNSEGKEVARYELPQWSSVQHLKLPELSAGVYLARLISDKSVAGVKFFVE